LRRAKGKVLLLTGRAAICVKRRAA
jgi:hypothetical protein